MDLINYEKALEEHSKGTTYFMCQAARIEAKKDWWGSRYQVVLAHPYENCFAVDKEGRQYIESQRNDLDLIDTSNHVSLGFQSMKCWGAGTVILPSFPENSVLVQLKVYGDDAYMSPFTGITENPEELLNPELCAVREAAEELGVCTPEGEILTPGFHRLPFSSINKRYDQKELQDIVQESMQASGLGFENMGGYLSTSFYQGEAGVKDQLEIVFPEIGENTLEGVALATSNPSNSGDVLIPVNMELPQDALVWATEGRKWGGFPIILGFDQLHSLQNSKWGHDIEVIGFDSSTGKRTKMLIPGYCDILLQKWFGWTEIRTDYKDHASI